jgi:hypothetical protein
VLGVFAAALALDQMKVATFCWLKMAESHNVEG